MGHKLTLAAVNTPGWPAQVKLVWETGLDLSAQALSFQPLHLNAPRSIENPFKMSGKETYEICFQADRMWRP